MDVLARLALLLAAAGAAAAQEQHAGQGAAPAAALALAISSRAIQDSRCYLMNGGAVESFYIAEDTPVGSVIGSLSVHGDPRPGGNISLRLQERGAGLALAAGSSDVTLVRALDRELRDGPASLYVNVRCERRGTSDPSFIIPVSVRVWDVNDNAPAWLGAPYVARLSELAAPGTRVPAAIRAADADQPGPHASVRYSVLPGRYAEYFSFPNELEGTLVLRKSLDYETHRNVSVGLRAQDAGDPPLHNDTTLDVLVLDADDQNPRFSHEHYTALVPDDAEEGTILRTSPEPVSAKDQDAGIDAPLYYTATGDNAHLISVDRDTGALALTARLLAEPEQSHTFVIKATQVDNADRYALATVTARRGAAGGVRFVRRLYAAAVREDARPGAVLLALATLPAPTEQKPLQFYVSEKSFLDKFAINAAGELLLRRALDYETEDSYLYQVMVTDGVSNDTATINLTVVDVNEWEPRFRYPQYSFHVEARQGAGLVRVGRLDAHDGDRPGHVALQLQGPHASMFTVEPSGELFLRQEALGARREGELHVVATAVDAGSPPRQTSVPVVVHVSERAGGGGGGRGAALTAALGGALAALLATVGGLLAYIYRSRRRSKPTPSNSKTNIVGHEKVSAPLTLASPPASVRGAGGAGGAGGEGGAGGGSGSLLSVSAGASTILADSSSSLELADHEPAAGRTSQRASRSKVAPQPPGAAPSGPGPGGGLAHMSDHLARGAGRSGVAWPSATIPARVKKLSWGDAAPPQGSAGSEPVHDATDPALSDMNLTVYF